MARLWMRLFDDMTSRVRLKVTGPPPSVPARPGWPTGRRRH